MEQHELDSSSSRQGEEKFSCEHGNEPSGSMKFENLLTSYGTVSSSRTPLRRVSCLK